MGDYNLTQALSSSQKLKEMVEQESGVKLTDCYQCGKCTAGCPVAFAMDYTPRKILRLLQIGMVEEALRAESIWLCATCDTCHARCPHGINIPRVMEVLRIEADKRGIRPIKTTNLFGNLFLQSVEKFGRVHEMGMMVRYNIFSTKLFQDALHAPKLLLTSKISPFPHKIKDRDAVKKIFENVRARGGNI